MNGGTWEGSKNCEGHEDTWVSSKSSILGTIFCFGTRYKVDWCWTGYGNSV
ncbi:conserved hypothetical protein, partial [Ricinus communis]